MIDEWNNDCSYDFKNIQFKHLHDSTRYPDYYYTFSTVIDGTVTDHSLLPGYCYSNTMKEYTNSNMQRLNNNIFLNMSKTNRCYSNSFGSDCYYNFFGSDCYYNSFGNYCHNNSFENNCSSNSFGNHCDNNSFGDYCHSNSFGNYCQSNSFGSDCYYNFFGSGCYYNSFGNYYQSNSFGNECRYNSFGNWCRYNSFGNYCHSNSFRVSASQTAALKNYVCFNHFDNGCSCNIIWNADTTSDIAKLQNINVNRGVLGSYSSPNMINITELDQNYELQVANNSQGEIKVYCAADFDKQIANAITTTLNTEV